jgi:hypothetical protein
VPSQNIYFQPFAVLFTFTVFPPFLLGGGGRRALMAGNYVSVEGSTNRPVVYPPNDKRVNMRQRWNDIDRGEPKNSEKNLSQWHFILHKSDVKWPAMNPGLCVEKPVTTMSWSECHDVTRPVNLNAFHIPDVGRVRNHVILCMPCNAIVYKKLKAM